MRNLLEIPSLAALVAWVAIAAAAPARAAITFEEGVAREPGSGRLLYREHHLVRREQGRALERLVLYRCPGGTAFARKHVDYRASATAPAFALEDARLGYREGLRRGASRGELFVRDARGAPERSAPVGGEGLVADAGFDEFIRAHWRPLLAGEAVPLRFVVPSRLESLGFRVRRVGSARVGDEAAVVFRLRLGGWLGWLAPHIDVAYGRDSRRLLRFEGLSNLRDDAGAEQLVAAIEFPVPARPAGEAQWRAFAREPLSACRTRA